ncbi:MAG: aldehyde dehydrogenase family protein [Thermoleophilaceae bacterium]|nr:aldehyde dehydrogenase family protein [Thermoleophilaceae bacterium]
MHLGGALLRRAGGLRRLPRTRSSHTRELRVGDPLDPATDVGPMVSASQRANVQTQVESAVAAGAELVVGGDRAGYRRGHYFAPAVVTGAPPETDLLREETFGPVAPIVPVASLDEAIELANSTRFGLGANVYRATSRPPFAACARSARDRLDQRPAHRQ